MLEKFENEVILKKRIKCFPFRLRRRNFKTQQSRSFWICVWKKHSVREITWLSWDRRFQKALFIIVFCPHDNERPLVNSFRLKSLFEKLRFLEYCWRAPISSSLNVRKDGKYRSSRISVDGRPNRRKKAAFSRFLPDGTIILKLVPSVFFSLSLISGVRLGTEDDKHYLQSLKGLSRFKVKLGVASPSKQFFSAQERWRKNEDWQFSSWRYQNSYRIQFTNLISFTNIFWGMMIELGKPY